MPDFKVVGFTPADQAAPPLAPPVASSNTPTSAFFNPTPQESATLAEIRRRESSGDYGATNPKSTASGAYQFINRTWQDTSKKTGVPLYATAKEAPQWVQDVNALDLLREHGPNSSASWQASGPYPVGKATVTPPGSPRNATATPPAATGGGGDNYANLMSRLMSGEDVDITPAMTPQFTGQPQALQPSPMPAKQPQPFAITGFTPAPSEPEPSPLSKAATSFWEGMGGPQAVEDIKQTFTGAGPGRVVEDAITGLIRSAAAEPKRIAGEASYASAASGPEDTMYHLAGMVPLLGPAIQQTWDDYARKAYAEGLGHGAAVLAQVVGPKAVEAAIPAVGAAREAVGGAVETAKEAVGGLGGGKFGAAVSGAVKGAREAAPAAKEAALDKSLYGVLGGPIGMAKAGATAAVRELAKGAFKGAREALAGEPTAAEAALEAATPAPTPGQALATSKGVSPAQWEAMPAEQRQMFENMAPAAGAAAQPSPSVPPTPEAIPPATPPAAPVPPLGVTAQAQGPPTSAAEDIAIQKLQRSQGLRYNEAAAVVRQQPTPPAAPSATPAATRVRVLHAEEPAPGSPSTPPAATLPPETAQLPPEEAEAAFRTATGQPPAPVESGPRLAPLPSDVPPHYRALQELEGTSAAVRAYQKDARIAAYVESQGLTADDFEKLPLEEQNKLIRAAPSAGGGKNRAFLPKPTGAAPRAVGRWADEGIRDIVATMRWRQSQR